MIPAFAQPVPDENQLRFRIFSYVVPRFTGFHRTFIRFILDSFVTGSGSGLDPACSLGYHEGFIAPKNIFCIKISRMCYLAGDCLNFITFCIEDLH